MCAANLAEGATDESFCGPHKLYRMDDAEVHIERPDGSRVVVIVNIAPLIDDSGTIVGAMNNFYDASDRNDIEGARVKPFSK